MENVYIKDCNFFEYNNSTEFKPCDYYAEMKNNNISIASDKRVYDAIRNLFIEMKLDKKNIGTINWNPFSDFIKQGDKVLIKPNLVRHNNMNTKESVDCVITNFSVIRVIIDYVILALGNTGRIVVGDAPVQECIFSKVTAINNLNENLIKYKKIYKDIELIDLRKNNNKDLECLVVKLGSNSSLVPLDKLNGEYSVMNYNLKLMKEHHSLGKHEYVIPKKVLESDVIINLPKPKSHKKAGMTACMKNFVGAVGNKESVPHHRTGSSCKHGDEFPEDDWMKNIHAILKKQSYRKNILIDAIRKIFSIILRKRNLLYYESGSWYGNDTLWRTILDLNKIVNYASKEGKLTEKKQRIIFNVADMIVSGEKEGPLMPTRKNVGYIVASFNSMNMDRIISNIMGFNPNKIKYLSEGILLTKYKLGEKNFKVFFENKELKNKQKINKKFIPADGWKDYIEQK